MDYSNPRLSFREVEVSFRNEAAGVTLSGTLSLPHKDGKLPAVILFPGSGAVDRDSTFGEFKPFKIIADHFARTGIAVFRFDKRGVGKSTGEFATVAEEDLVQDGCAAIEYIESRNEINPRIVGLLGHSEGGLIASKVAERSVDIPFLIIMAGPIVPGTKNASLVFTLLVNEDKAKIQHFDEDEQTFHRFFSLVKQPSLSQVQRDECVAIARNVLPRITDTTKAVLGFSQLTPETFVSIFAIPWMRELLNSTPESVLKKIKCPILGIYGSKDVQVPIQNSEALKTILKQSGNVHSVVKEIENVNHLFQSCKTGYPSEYLTNPQTIIPDVLELTYTWIAERINK